MRISNNFSCDLDWVLQLTDMNLTNISAPYETSYDCNNTPLKMRLDEWKLLWEARDRFSWWFGDVGLTTLACCGSVLDVLSISILKTEKLACNFNKLLSSVSIIDICFLVSSMLHHVLNTDTNSHSSIWTAILLIYVIGPLRSISMSASIYMTLALSYDRFKAISRPQEYRIKERLSSSSVCGELTLSITTTIKVLIPSVVFYLPQFFMFEIRQNLSPCGSKDLTSMSTVRQDIICNTITYSVHATELRTNDHFNLWYINIGNFIFTVVLPLFLIIVFNVITYRKVKVFYRRQSNLQRQETKQINMAYQLFVFVLLFTACHTLRVILNVVEYFRGYPEANKGIHEMNICDPPSVSFWLIITILPISSFMISFFASSNFFIYVLFNKDFRITLKEKLLNLLECHCRIQLNRNNRHFNDNLSSINPNAANANEMGSMGARPNIDAQVPN